MPYMNFVDGMRAIAVLAVIIYHFGFQFLPGGFIGVDVFFVISGFLITGIVHRKILDNSFSLREFYERRFKRLLPALALVVLSTLAVAPLFLHYQSLVDLSQSAASVSLFLSNVFFWQTDNYFSEAASLRPLLHTWSLGVEEQFYAVFPVVLLLLLRLGRGGAIVGLAVILLLSYGANIYLSQYHPNAAFYLLPARIWEFLLGAFAAMYTTRASALSSRSRNCLATFGAALLGYGFVTINSHDIFPGHIALIPVVGSCLLIVGSMGGRTIVGDLLSTRPMRYVGLISYSLYLWHWVVAALSRSAMHGEFTLLQQFSLIGLTFALSVFTYHCVEKPFRFAPRLAQVFNLRGGFLVLLTILITAVGYGHYFKQRTLALINAMPAKEMLFYYMKPCEFSRNFRLDKNECSFGDVSSERTFVVWGDSHGIALLSGFDLAGREAGWYGLSASKSGCPPLLGVYMADDRVRCGAEFGDEVAQFLEGGEIDHVFLVARWPMYQTGKIINGQLAPDRHFVSDSEGISETPEASARVLERALRRTVGRLTSIGVPTTIVAPTPVWPRVRKKYSPPDQSLSRAEYLAQRDSISRLLTELAQHPLVNILDPADVLCPAAECQLFEDGEPLYNDHNHLAPRGAQKLSGLIQSALADDR